MDAWERGDVDAVVSMLTEDAAFAMPPLRDLVPGPRGDRRLPGRLAALRAVALAPRPGSRKRAGGARELRWDAEEKTYLPFALNMLTLRGAQISEVTAFLTRSTEDPDRRVLARLPEQPADPRRVAVAFERFGLPARLD